jgi:hypothetical protein
MSTIFKNVLKRKPARGSSKEETPETGSGSRNDGASVDDGLFAILSLRRGERPKHLGAVSQRGNQRGSG